MLETTWEVQSNGLQSLAIAVDRCEVIFELISVSWLYRDTAGQERYETITTQYYRRAHVSLVVEFMCVFVRYVVFTMILIIIISTIISMDTNNIFWRAWKIILICENDLNSAGGPIYFQFSRITIKKDSLVMFPFGEIKANIVGEKKTGTVSV